MTQNSSNHAIETTISAEFQLDESLIYLNHAAVSPWPQRTARAIEAFAETNTRRGAADYPQWIETEQLLRTQLADLINAASADDIALMKNTSEALSAIAYGIDWKAGDNVVLFRQEFPSNRVVWQSLQRFGVETRLVDLDLTTDESPEQSLFAQCDENTRLITTSSVQYANGLRIDLEQIGRFCQRHDILFCVDAIQSLGALNFDVESCQADFVVADGHKWLMAPEGLALFYSRPSIRDDLRLHEYGWHMLADPSAYDSLEWTPAASARRFECGSPNMLGIHALSASLSLIQYVGIHLIENMVLDNTRYFIELCNIHDNLLEIMTETSEHRRSGIVTFRPRRMAAEEAYQRLMARGVICACRGGGVRFSPHFYTSREKIDEAFSILISVVS